MNTRMVAPNVEGEYYKSVHDFLQHNFPERDDQWRQSGLKRGVALTK